MPTQLSRTLQVWIVLAALLAGCATMPTDIRQANASSISRLVPGMSRQEVMQAMGTGSATVREAVYVEQRLAGYIDLAVTNPYRLETDVIGGNRFEILYYYARPNGMGLGYWDTQFADRAVPDWFLTPVVLENGRLVGWGPEVLEREGLARPPASPDEDRWLYVGRCCLEHAPRH